MDPLLLVRKAIIDLIPQPRGDACQAAQARSERSSRSDMHAGLAVRLADPVIDRYIAEPPPSDRRVRSWAGELLGADRIVTQGDLHRGGGGLVIAIGHLEGDRVALRATDL